MINGSSYHMKSHDDHRTVQNSGIMLVATIMQVSSVKGKKLIVCDMSFYGRIQEILEVNYNTFKVENNASVQMDDVNYTMLDLNQI